MEEQKQEALKWIIEVYTPWYERQQTKVSAGTVKPMDGNPPPIPPPPFPPHPNKV
jgi:hypothetical protein